MSGHDQAQVQTDRAFTQLQYAVATARQAADRAEQCISMYPDQPSTAAASVMHALTWGLANATSSIESAMSAIEDAHVIRRLVAEQAASAPVAVAEPSKSGEPS